MSAQDPLSEAREALRSLVFAQGPVLLGVARADAVLVLARLEALPAPPATLYDLIERYLTERGWTREVSDDTEVCWFRSGDPDSAVDFFDAIDQQQSIDDAEREELT